jgi:chromosome transmission fidelity protein 1
MTIQDMNLGKKCVIWFSEASEIPYLRKRRPGYANLANQDDNHSSCTKIFYASRTHSQLSQVIPELKKLRRELHRNKSLSLPNHPTAVEMTGDKGGKRKSNSLGSDADIDCGRPETRFVSLGSRKQLCLNEKLKAKGGDLDERCRELLQGTILQFLHLISGSPSSLYS